MPTKVTLTFEHFESAFYFYNAASYQINNPNIQIRGATLGIVRDSLAKASEIKIEPLKKRSKKSKPTPPPANDHPLPN